MITLPQLILASASLPLIGYGAFLIHHGDRLDGTYGIIGGIYTFILVTLIPYGFPGFMVFPGAMIISSIGGFHSYIVNRSKGKIVKGVALLGIAIILLVFQLVI